MTKTAMKQLAKQARRYGYHSSPVGRRHGATISVRCPLCEVPVERVFSQYSHDNSIIKTLDAAVMDHLADYHADAH